VSDLPIACTLSAAELAERRAGLLPGLAARAHRRLALPNGCEWQFEPADGLLAEMMNVIDMERRCCRFLRFSVSVEVDAGPIVLQLTGPPGTREFLEALVEGASADPVPGADGGSTDGPGTGEG